MPESGNLWCMTGLRGATDDLCEGFKQDKDLEFVDRDAGLEQLWMEVDWPSVAKCFNGQFFVNERQRNGEMRNQSERMKLFVNRALKILCGVGFINNPGSRNYIDFLSQVRQLGFYEFFQCLGHGPWFSQMIMFIADFESMNTAVDGVVCRNKPVVLHHPNFVHRENRESSLGYFRLKGVEPGLLLVKERIEMLMGKAAFRALGGDGPDYSFISNSDDYTPAENWPRLRIVQGSQVNGHIGALKSRLLDQIGQEITGPVKFFS